MCKYIYAHHECGHRVDDTADTRGCPYYTSRGCIPCDPDNPTNRHRVTVTSETRNGICERCRRVVLERSELDAMQREIEKARELSLKEKREREEAAKKHEEGLFRESREEFERSVREKERKDLEAALKASKKAEARRARHEEEDLAKALKASRALSDAERNRDVAEQVSNRGQFGIGGGPVHVIEVQKTTTNTTKKVASAPAPPPPPPLPVKPTPPVEKGQTKPIIYTVPPVGDQTYGNHFIGTRRQPIHESQQLQELTPPPSPPKSSARAPFVRLGSTINASDVPIVREARPTVPVPGGDMRSNLRRTSGPRSPVSMTGGAVEDDELSRKLARRRTWEPEEDTATELSENASNIGNASVIQDGNMMTASVRVESDLDKKRKQGWRKE